MAIDKEIGVRYRETIVQSANPIMVEDEFGLTMFLGHFIKMLEVYDAMFVANLNGEIISSHGPSFKRVSGSKTPLTGLSAEKEPCFNTVILNKVKTNEAAFGTFKVHPWAKLLGGGDGRVLVYSAPITGRMGDIERVLCQFASWERTLGAILKERQVVAEGPKSQKVRFFVMDSKGLVWDSSEKITILKENLLTKGLVSAQMVNQHKIGFVSERDLEGNPVLTGFAPTTGGLYFKNPELGILVMSELGTATQTTSNLKTSFIFVGAIGGLFILLAAWFISGQLVSPLQMVVKELDKLAKGDLRGKSDLE